MDYKDIIVDRDYISRVVKNNKFNTEIIKYYNILFDKYANVTIFNKIERMKDCNKIWLLDTYYKQKIKDYKKTNLCKDKFCNNCKKVKQAARMSKFIPELEKYKCNLYHLVLTIPNCSGEDLRQNIKNIFSAYAKFIELLKGKKKIKGVNFEKYNYLGSVRSLEVTYSGNNYHPHLHCVLVLNNYIEVERNVKNDYSYNYGSLKTLFTNDEILIQKIWYLLINNIRLSKKEIDKLEHGYSCNLKKFKEDDYAELFKYMCKTTSEEGEILTYENFEVLYFALLNLRQIQGYGCLFNISDETDPNEINDMYDKIIDELKEIELPKETFESPLDLLSTSSDYIVISRKKIYKYLRDIK